MLLYHTKLQQFKHGGTILVHARLPKEMKDKIKPYLLSTSSYRKGKVWGLVNVIEGGFSMGADKNGFFIHTHRGRSKSFKTPESIPEKDRKWVESTG